MKGLGRFFAVMMALTLMPASALAASEAPATPREMAPQHSGVVVAARAGDFTLVTLGNWPVQRQRDLLDRHDASANFQRRTQPTTAISGHSRNNIFRRAIYLRDVLAAERQYALPHGLLDALIWTESRYNPLALSKAGAAGLGQLMPATARELGVINRYDPSSNLSGAARYLRQLLDRFGVVHLAIAAYNAGPGAIQDAHGIPNNAETPGYVQSVLIAWRNLAR